MKSDRFFRGSIIKMNNAMILGYIYNGSNDASLLLPSNYLQPSVASSSKGSSFGENIIRV